MDTTRRKVAFGIGTLAVAATLGSASYGAEVMASRTSRRFKFVHIDVFTAQPLLGNPLDVFLDARGMSDAQMLAVTRETFLSEAAFVFPRDAATERERGIRVRIFTPEGEVPFAGHPTLGTATVLRNLRLASQRPGKSPADSLAEISLDLNVGKVPVAFHAGESGQTFGEMRQVPPRFGVLHDRETIARLHNFSADDIADDGPIQTVSTGLPFAIVPLKRLDSLTGLRIDAEKMNAYMAKQEPDFNGFYYVTRDTAESGVGIRALPLRRGRGRCHGVRRGVPGRVAGPSRRRRCRSDATYQAGRGNEATERYIRPRGP